MRRRELMLDTLKGHRSAPARANYHRASSEKDTSTIIFVSIGAFNSTLLTRQHVFVRHYPAYIPDLAKRAGRDERVVGPKQETNS